MVLAPWLLLLALVIGGLVLIPARRLQAAGVSQLATGSYALVLWLLGMLAAARPVGARILIPILLILYLAPFFIPPTLLARLFGRRPLERPPIKDVTPPDQHWQP